MKEELAMERQDLRNLVEALKKMENPNPRLLDLLHVICERFPPVDALPKALPEMNTVVMSCRCEHSPHAVSPCGFLYLEEVERAMGSTLQRVERVAIDKLEEPWLADLESHLLRHCGTTAGVDTKVDVDKLICNNKESVKAMSTLMQHCERLDVRNALFIWVDLGTEGWRALGKTLSCTHGNVKEILEQKSTSGSACFSTNT